MQKLLALTLLAVLLLLGGCECIGGLGRDIQTTGRWLEDTSKQVQQ